jgi:hypothetical protein
MKAWLRLLRRKRFVSSVLAYSLEEGRALLGAIVWAFALLGILGMVQAMIDPTRASIPFLGASGKRVSELELTQIPGLPEYPGAKRSEYRAEVFGDERVTEIEYIVDCSMPEIRDHYRDVFSRGQWTVSDTSWVRGEWVYTVSCGDRRGVVEIENRQDGLIEVEVEMAEPAVPRQPK